LTGHVWIGTEGSGVWRFDPSAPLGSQYTQFISATPVGPGDTQVGPGDTPIAPGDTPIAPSDTPVDPGDTQAGLGDMIDVPADTADVPADTPVGSQSAQFISQVGPGDDNAYALACDKAGRVWVGTLNHGVSVFNGKTWRTYGPADGPLGSRVFALAVSPKDGSVWGATEAGLFRYDQSRWTYFTRANGLPSDQANALAFAADGTLYVGTQCDGIAVGSPVNDYKTWRVTPGPKQLPNAATGTGLPSGLINALLVVRDGTVYAGTNCGLAASGDQGRTWHFRRGADWKAKLAGLADPIAPSQHHITGKLLREDYVTCLAEDADHSLWIGHRQKGVELYYRDPRHRLIPDVTDPDKSEFIDSLLPDGPGLWVGHYGEGLALRYAPDVSSLASSHNVAVPPLPVPAKPPTLAELNAMLRVVSAVPPDNNELASKVVALDDDWLTQGDWLGRYGRYWACLCAMVDISHGSDFYGDSYTWGAGWENVNYKLTIGSNPRSDDALRYWIHWRYSDNPHVLEMPLPYLHSRVIKGYTTWKVNRREDEVDDHGEVYDYNIDGPHVYCTLQVPVGLYYLSLYDFNKDGHDSNNRFRDYRLSIRPHDSNLSMADVSNFGKQPELAHGRIENFWGGVWKKFLVRGPQELTIEVNRNNSFNTILPAVTLDLVDEKPAPYFLSVEDWKTKQGQNEQERQSFVQDHFIPHYVSACSADKAANMLFDALAKARLTNSSWWSIYGRRLYFSLMREYATVVRQPHHEKDTEICQHLGTCYYYLGQYRLWEKLQKAAGLVTARQIEQGLRWDEVSASNSGRGYEVVTGYLSAHAQSKTAQVTKQSRSH
jgi:hypothetical protein